MFSTTNSFHHGLKPGALLQLLEEAVSSRRVKVRILAPLDAAIDKAVVELKNQGIIIRDYKNPLRVTAIITTLVVDQAYSLTVEFQDNANLQGLSQEESMELATYSNSEYTALSYVSIFETHWMQHEIYYEGAKRQQPRNHK